MKQLGERLRENVENIYNKSPGIKILNIERILTIKEQRKKKRSFVHNFFETAKGGTQVAIQQKLTSLVMYFLNGYHHHPFHTDKKIKNKKSSSTTWMAYHIL